MGSITQERMTVMSDMMMRTETEQNQFLMSTMVDVVAWTAMRSDVIEYSNLRIGLISESVQTHPISTEQVRAHKDTQSVQNRSEHTNTPNQYRTDQSTQTHLISLNHIFRKITNQQEDSEPSTIPLNNTAHQRDSSESPDSPRSHSSEQSSRNRSFSSRGSGRNPRRSVERRDMGSDTSSGQSDGLAALFTRLRRERGENRTTGVGGHFQGDTESEDHKLADYLTSDEFNAIQKVE